MHIFSSQRFKNIYDKLQYQPRITSLKKMKMPSLVEFFGVIAPQAYPVIFTTPQPKKFNLQRVRSLLDAHSQIILKVRTGPYYKPERYLNDRKYVEMTLGDYTKTAFDNRKSALVYAGNQALPSSLWADFELDYPPFYASSDFEPPAFWLGPKGSVTPLHKDSADNFAFHVFGKKRWILYPVRDAPFLQMTRAMDRPDSDFAPSRIDLTEPPSHLTEDFQQAVALTVELEAGDILYLPAGWAHFVENLEPSLMVNIWLSLNKHEPAVLESPVISSV